MDKTNTTFTSHSIFESSKQERANSRFHGGLVLAVVIALHSVIAFELLSASKEVVKKPPMMMEVAMVTLPKPKLPEPPKPIEKEPPPAPVVKPVVKKEVVKPKPIVKPEPVKKITPPKPVLQPKVLTTTTETAETSIPKFEAAPTISAPVQPPAPAVETKSAPSKSAETSGHGQEAAVSSGGNCENCDSIEKRLQRRYARRNFSGSVSFVFTISEDGKVLDAHVKNTEPADMFDDDTIAEIKESLMEMEFEPKITNGKAISFKGTKTIKFQSSK